MGVGYNAADVKAYREKHRVSLFDAQAAVRHAATKDAIDRMRVQQSWDILADVLAELNDRTGHVQR